MTTVWRYKAVPLDGPGGRGVGGFTRGELSGESAVEVRASLRRIGLAAVEVKPLRAAAGSADVRGSRTAMIGGRGEAIVRSLRDQLGAHLRARHQPRKAEVFDGLATMLESGIPLLEAVTTLAGNPDNAASLQGDQQRPSGRKRSERAMLVQVREGLRGGESLADALEQRCGLSWFDPAEVAIVRAAQHAGTLPESLRRLADRHQRSGELTGKLMGALTYPLIVSIVGVGVVIFLSTQTLPELTGILENSGVPVPRLTTAIMSVGQTLASHWFALLLGIAALAAGGVGLRAYADAHPQHIPRWTRRCVPGVVRRIAVARLCQGLAELIRSGVPVVEALRVLAPTSQGPGSGGLRRIIGRSAQRIEHGEPLGATLDDDLWFDAELRRVIEVAEHSGTLDDMLERIGNRYERRARRMIDRLASVLEPAVILVLAVLIGTVVVGAVLPMLRLKEVV